MPHICIGELGQQCIGSDNGVSPIRRQATIETNARLLYPQEQASVKFWSKYKFHSQKCICKYRMRNGGYFVQGEMS